MKDFEFHRPATIKDAIATAGTMAAIIFPVRSSRSVTGVVSTVSSVLCSRSPITA